MNLLAQSAALPPDPIPPHEPGQRLHFDDLANRHLFQIDRPQPDKVFCRREPLQVLMRPHVVVEIPELIERRLQHRATGDDQLPELQLERSEISGSDAN